VAGSAAAAVEPRLGVGVASGAAAAVVADGFAGCA